MPHAVWSVLGRVNPFSPYLIPSIMTYKQYYPSSNQFRDPPTYTHQPSMQQKVPFSLISCSSSKVAFCSCVEWGWHIYNIVESESDPLTRRAVDLFEKEPLKGNSEVHLHTPTKFGEDRSKDLGGDREQTDRQTNAARFIVWLCINALVINTLDVLELTLKVLNFWKFSSYCSLKPLWSGMREVVPACTSPTLHPPSPPTVHQLSRLAL